jgi:hypothetical protein
MTTTERLQMICALLGFGISSWLRSTFVYCGRPSHTDFPASAVPDQPWIPSVRVCTQLNSSKVLSVKTETRDVIPIPSALGHDTTEYLGLSVECRWYIT